MRPIIFKYVIKWLVVWMIVVVIIFDVPLKASHSELFAHRGSSVSFLWLLAQPSLMGVVKSRYPDKVQVTMG